MEFNLEPVVPPVHIRAPTIPSSKTPRPSLRTSFDTPNLTFKHPPKPPKIQKNKKIRKEIPPDVPIKPFPPYVPPEIKPLHEIVPSLQLSEKIEERISSPKTPWTDGFELANETDALTYVAAVDPENDFLQFHFGSAESKKDPFSFRLARMIHDKNEFETISKRGVLSARVKGNSEFLPIDEFVTSKTQYNMLQTIKFFSQFKINKAFTYWRLKTVRSTFMKRLESFTDLCWIAKKSFPPVNNHFRRTLFKVNVCQVFPIKIQNEAEFENIKEDLFNAREEFAVTLSEVAKEINQSLVSFAKKVNETYEQLTSPESINYMDMKKIPADLFHVHKVPCKKSLSMVEEKQLKIEHKIIVKKALLEVQTVENFFKMCDKTILSYFLHLMRTQFHDFSSVFIDPAHELHIRVVLDFEEDHLRFYPSYAETKAMLNEHFSTVNQYLNNFVRPILFDPHGSGKETSFKPENRLLATFINEHPEYAADMSALESMVKESYDDAMETFNLYNPFALDTHKIRLGWEDMKEREKDPQVYITNLTELTRLQQMIESFKGTYIHKLVLIDAKHMRNGLLDFLKKTIEENNTILFRNFEQICKTVIDTVNEFITSLQLPDDSLESQAAFNSSINAAKEYKPELEDKTNVVTTIYNRALTCAPMLIPILVTSLKAIKEAAERFNETLESAQRAMIESRERVINNLINKKNGLEASLGALHAQVKEQFTTVETSMPADIAIEKLEKAIDKTDDLIEQINQFKATAQKLGYSEYDFDLVSKIREDLQTSLGHWQIYDKFMTEIKGFTETNVMEVNIKELIAFLEAHNEREMRAMQHPLYDKMANYYATTYQYMPFFTVITKIELDEELWKAIFDILKVEFDAMKTTSLRQFLNQKVLASTEQIRIYIMNLQQQADLSQTFDAYILKMKSIVLVVIDSLTTKPKFVTFPSIYEAMSACESFQLYLHTLKMSAFYAQIEKQVIYWEMKLFQLIQVLSAMLEFQTKYIFVSEATSALFGEIHFAHEEQAKRFVDEWYHKFVTQIGQDPHILNLSSRIDPNEPKKSTIPKGLIGNLKTTNFSEVIEKGLDAKPSKKRKVEEKPMINKEFDKPIFNGPDILFQGDILVQCLEEGKTRCEFIMSQLSYLFEQQRQKFPRFYFCTDEQVLQIMLACANINFIVNDLTPVFPSLSRFLCSMGGEADTIMGAISTTGEMFQFRTDFPFTGLQVVDILNRVETELKGSIRSSILDAVSGREFTQPNQWIIRYPTQAMLVAESVYFCKRMNQILAKGKENQDWKSLITKNNEFIKAASDYISESPAKSASIAALTALKIRHRDILEEIAKSEEEITPNSYIWKKHIGHLITHEPGKDDQVYVTTGDMKFQYGYELIANASFGPLNDAEDEAMMVMASCMTSAEFSVTKQMSGLRYLIKAFADVCGIPTFTMPGSMINNLFSGAASVPSVIRLTDINDLPASFPNFYGLIESNSKVMKCESHFRKLNLQEWCTLIHIDEEKVPTWLMSRLRPINIAPVPPKEFIEKLKGIRQLEEIDDTKDIEYIIEAVKSPACEDLLFGFKEGQKGTEAIDVWFDLPEYILTGKFVAFKEPARYEIPLALKQKILSMATLFETYDAFAPHSQAPDYPIIPFATDIKLYVRDYRAAFLCIFGALRERAPLAQIHLMSIEEKKISFQIIGFRPVNLIFYTELNHDTIDAFVTPEISNTDLMEMAIQHNELLASHQAIEPYTKMFTSQSPIEGTDLINVCISKINLIRNTMKNTTLFSPEDIAGAIFTDQLLNVRITEERELATPFALGIPIVVKGEMSKGKRKYLKRLILQNTKPEDTILFSSPYNETIDMNICDNLQYITRGFYGPKNGGKVYICIFDINEASEVVKNFIIGLIMFGSVYVRAQETYRNVENVHLIVTSNNTSLFEQMKCPYALIEDYNVLPITIDEVDNDNVRPAALTLVKEHIKNSKLFHKGREYLNALDSVRTSDQFFINTTLYFGIDVALKAAECYNMTPAQMKLTLNKNPNNCSYMPDFHFVSTLAEVTKMNKSAFVVTNDLSPVTMINDVDYIVLNPRFRTQLFSALVKVCQEKKKTVVVANLRFVNPNDVFNLLDFIVLNPENVEETTYFEQADIQIFKHYLCPHNNDVNVILELLKYVSFFIVCNPKEYESIVPETLKKKVITIERYDCSDITPESTTCIDESAPFKPYIKISPNQFDEIVAIRSSFIFKRFEEFVDNLEKLSLFLQGITSLRLSVENIGSGNTITESLEKELKQKMEELQERVKVLTKRVEDSSEKKNQKTNELQILAAKISTQAPKDIDTCVAAICSFSLEEQVTQINAWANTKNEYQPYTAIFKEVFSFISTANFTSTGTTYCKLVQSIKSFSLEDSIIRMITKLQMYGLSKDSPSDSLVQRLIAMEEAGKIDSPNPMINEILKWLCIIIHYCWWQEDIQQLSAELTQITGILEADTEQLDTFKEQLESVTDRLVKSDSGAVCPQWLATAWTANETEVRRVIDVCDETLKILNNLAEESADTMPRLRTYAAALTAYEYGFGELPLDERIKILKGTKASALSSPLDMLELMLDQEIVFPIARPLSIFTSAMFSPRKVKGQLFVGTSVPFSNIMVADLLIGTGLLPRSSKFFNDFKYPDADLPPPTMIMYDPLDIAHQALIANYPHAKVCFTSSPESNKELISAISAGSTLIVNLDSYDSIIPFFEFQKHVKLQIAANGTVHHEEIHLNASKTFKVFYITKLSDVKIPGAVMANFDVENIENTKWFEFASVFAVNPQIEGLASQSVSTIAQKTNEILSALKQLATYKFTGWPEIFEHSQKLLSVRQLTEQIVLSTKARESALFNYKQLTDENTDHPQAIHRYKVFSNLCRHLASTDTSKQSVFQVISSIRDFARARQNMAMAPASSANSFMEVVMTYINQIPCNERMGFLAKFETKFMKEAVQQQYLVFDQAFPRLGERNIGPLMPQLINHVNQKFLSVPRSYFSFVSPDSLPQPGRRPVIIILDDLIPTDFYSRGLSQYLTAHSVMLLTVGSFSNVSLPTPDSILNIVKGCAEKEASLLLIFDELIPDFVIPSLIHYSHLTGFCNYYILVRELLSSKIPIIPGAIKVVVSRPCAMHGCSRFLNMVPYYRRNPIRAERPFLYLMLILAHRNDFPIRLLHILPIVKMMNTFWVQRAIEDKPTRDLWHSIMSAVIRSMSNNPLLHNAYDVILDKFFQSETPTMPASARIDFDNESVFSQEVPPSAAEKGLLADYNDCIEYKQTYGWKEHINGRHLVLGRTQSAVEIIEGAILVNARWREEVITSVGERTLDISIVEEEPPEVSGSVKVAIYDGQMQIATASSLFSGADDVFEMANIFVVLPPVK